VKLLLDTCTFLWIVTGAQELSRKARDAFTEPTHEIYLSVVSAWEIALKNALGKLPLPRPPAELVPDLRARHRIESLSLDETAALAVPRLPDLHRDPFDRVLISQAIMGGMTLVTPDPLITQYPVPTLW
jgi:PIN domain nuclease of toxin-antitoxin system